MINKKKVMQKTLCILLLSSLTASSLMNVYAYEPHTVFRINPKTDTEFVIPPIPEERLIPKDNIDKHINVEYASSIYQKSNGKYYFTPPSTGDKDSLDWVYAPSGTTPFE